MKWALLSIVILIALLGAGLFAYATLKPSESHDAITFINAYGAYAEMANELHAAINVPGSQDNPHHINLRNNLEKILTADISPEERLELAQAAKAETDGLREEIDIASQKREKVEGAIRDVEGEQKILDSSDLLALSGQLLSVMESRQNAVVDLAATLYAVNGQTEEILDQIIADGGALTDAHIIAINNATNDAEQRYERLRQEYETLSLFQVELDQISKEFVEEAW